MADLIIEHCRKNKFSWHELSEITQLDFGPSREILLGEVDDKAFCELKDVAQELGITDINRLRYNRIKSMMAIHYINGIELAEHLGINPQTVSSWATNARQPRLDELYAIAAYFRCCPTELLG